MKKVSASSLIWIVVLAFLASVLVINVKNQTHITASKSCLESIAAYIQRTSGTGLISNKQQGEWHQISVAQLEKFAEGGNEFFDCKSQCKNSICDAWGRVIIIESKFDGSSIHVRVSSMGADGKLGSKDDLKEVVIIASSLK